jgi:hypothetical protein
MVKKISLFLIVCCLSAQCAFAQVAADDTNAATIYEKASSLLTDLPKNFNDKTRAIIDKGWIGDNNDIKELLIKNQPALNEFKKACVLTQCDFNFDKSIATADAKVLDVSKEVALVKLLLVEARAFEKENRLDAALENYIDALKFSSHCGQQNFFVPKLTEMITERCLAAPLADFLNNKSVNQKDLRVLFDTLISVRNKKTGLESSFETEKILLLNWTKTAAFEELKLKDKYPKNYDTKVFPEFERIINQFNDLLITAFKENKPELYREKLKNFVDETMQEGNQQTTPYNRVMNSLKALLGLPTETPSLIAKILFIYAEPQFQEGIITAYYTSLTRFDILLIATAAKVYKIEQGKAINTLQDLVPKYFAAIPNDPFNDFKPLKYEKTDKGWRVYSSGISKADLPKILKTA